MIHRCLVDGLKLGGDANHVAVSKDGIKIKFNIGMRMRKGALFCCMIKKDRVTLETTAAATKGSKQMSMTKAHYLLGHTHCRTAAAKANYLGWGKPKDSSEVCRMPTLC